MTGSACIVDPCELIDPEALLAQPYKLYDERRLFDWLGEDWRVSAVFTKGQEEPRLFYEAPGCSYAMSLGITEYVETLLEVRALFPWQELFIDDPSFVLDRAAAQAFIAKLELLFPDVDSARFRERIGA